MSTVFKDLKNNEVFIIALLPAGAEAVLYVKYPGNCAREYGAACFGENHSIKFLPEKHVTIGPTVQVQRVKTLLSL